MDATDFVEVSDLRSLGEAIRKLGIEAIDGMENGVQVLTVTIGKTLFMATIHNQCLKLMYRLRESNHPGGVDFSNKWNMYNFMGTLVPFTDGYAMKHETLVSNGIVAGNLKDTLTSFAQAIDKFQNEWFTLTS